MNIRDQPRKFQCKFLTKGRSILADYSVELDGIEFGSLSKLPDEELNQLCQTMLKSLVQISMELMNEVQAGTNPKALDLLERITKLIQNV